MPNDQSCISLTNLQGDLIECQIDLTAFDDSMTDHLANATKLHDYLVKKSSSYRQAYSSLINSSERKAAVALDSQGKLVHLANQMKSDGKYDTRAIEAGYMIGAPWFTKK